MIHSSNKSTPQRPSAEKRRIQDKVPIAIKKAVLYLFGRLVWWQCSDQGQAQANHSHDALLMRRGPAELEERLKPVSIGAPMLATPAELEERHKPDSIETSMLAIPAELEERLKPVSIGTSMLASPAELEERLKPVSMGTSIAKPSAAKYLSPKSLPKFASFYLVSLSKRCRPW